MSQPIPLSPPAQPTTRAQRAAARSRRRRRSLVVSGISTVVVIGGLATFILTSPGWPAVKQTFFSVSAFTSSFSSVLSGFWLDVKLFLIVEVVVLIVGLLIALVRTVRVPALFPVRMLAIVYVDVMRGVPTILVVYLIGFGVPALQLKGVPTGAAVLGGAALAPGGRVRPSQPGRGASRPRTDTVAGPKVRHRSQDGPAGGTAAAQRLH